MYTILYDMVSYIFVDVTSVNGILPDGIIALPEISHHLWDFLAIQTKLKYIHIQRDVCTYYHFASFWFIHDTINLQVHIGLYQTKSSLCFCRTKAEY